MNGHTPSVSFLNLRLGQYGVTRSLDSVNEKVIVKTVSMIWKKTIVGPVFLVCYGEELLF